MTAHRAFTLIELLIVVAIIAILAAIAVPNFLEAQVRSKVSRVKTDLRHLANMVEMYTMDWNAPPFDGVPGADKLGWVNSWTLCTTPVAYMTGIPTDVFQERDARGIAAPAGQTHYLGSRHSYDYATAYHAQVGLTYTATLSWMTHFGNSPWFTGSCGPDSTFYSAAGNFGKGNDYDPTNGTMSDGDIYRTASRIPK